MADVVLCSGDGFPVGLEGPGRLDVHWHFAGLHTCGCLCAGPQVTLLYVCYTYAGFKSALSVFFLIFIFENM